MFTAVGLAGFEAEFHVVTWRSDTGQSGFGIPVPRNVTMPNEEEPDSSCVATGAEGVRLTPGAGRRQ